MSSSDFSSMSDVSEEKPRVSLEVANSSRPLQLIKLNEYGIFEVCKEASSLISQIQAPIGIVSIGGPARSGKSLILNLLENDEGSGFKVGTTVRACTQGIWVWGEAFSIDSHQVIVLDSEGSNSVDGSKNVDSKIFAMLILISSLFIYNTKGVIDERALNSLSLAVYLSEILSSQESVSHTKFLWLLRDFHLELSTDPTQYMEDVLNSSEGDEFHQIRNMLFSIFTERECLTLPLPVDSVDELEDLKNKRLKDLRENFQEEFQKLQDSVVNCPIKKIHDSKINGAGFITFLKSIVQSINEGALPSIKNSWEMVVEKHYDELLSELKSEFRRAIEVKFPIEESDLINILYREKDHAIEMMDSTEVKDRNVSHLCKEKFESYFNEISHQMFDENFKSSEVFNLKLVVKKFENVIQYVDSEHTDFEAFERDWTLAIKNYSKEALGPSKYSILNEFIKNNHIFSKFFHNLKEKNQEFLDKELRESRRESRVSKQPGDSMNIKVIEKVGKYIEGMKQTLKIELDGRDLESDLNKIHHTVKEAKKQNSQQDTTSCCRLF